MSTANTTNTTNNTVGVPNPGTPFELSRRPEEFFFVMRKLVAEGHQACLNYSQELHIRFLDDTYGGSDADVGMCLDYMPAAGPAWEEWAKQFR